MEDRYNPKVRVVKYSLTEYGTVNNKFHWVRPTTTTVQHLIVGRAFNKWDNEGRLAACGKVIYCVDSWPAFRACKKCKKWEKKNLIEKHKEVSNG